MNHTDIENIMTAKVTEFITTGYILNAATMSGHQGEIAKVDLRKGDEIIRVLLTSRSAWNDDGCYQVTTLTVGRNTEKIRKSHPFDTMANTIWNNRLEIIEERNFYSVDSSADNFYENLDFLAEQTEKQMNRYRIRETYRRMRSKKDVTSDAAKAIVLPFIRRQDRCGRVKIDDIKQVVRFLADKYERMHYVVTLNNGKSFRLA